MTSLGMSTENTVKWTERFKNKVNNMAETGEKIVMKQSETHENIF